MFININLYICVYKYILFVTLSEKEFKNIYLFIYIYLFTSLPVKEKTFFFSIVGKRFDSVVQLKFTFLFISVVSKELFNI